MSSYHYGIFVQLLSHDVASGCDITPCNAWSHARLDETGLSPPVSCVSHAFASVHCCLVATCRERADLLALVGDVHCIFVTFPCGILGQV